MSRDLLFSFMILHLFQNISLLHFLKFNIWMNRTANGCAIMVLFVKDLPERNLHFLFLYLRQVFDWRCI